METAAKPKLGLKKALALLSLSISGSAIYQIPYLRYVYYDDLNAAFNMTNQQSGFLLSMYAIGCMLLYIPGGIIADRLPSRGLIIFSLGSTGLLGLILAFNMNYNVGLVMWFLMALTTTFVFWAALLKALRLLGGKERQASIYGTYYAVNNLVSMVANAIYLYLYNQHETSADKMFWVIIGMGTTCLLSALFVFLAYRDTTSEDQDDSPAEDKFKFSDLPLVFKNPNIWLASVIMFVMYTMYSCSNWFTPFFTARIGIEPGESAILAFIRLYVFILLAPLGGYVADRFLKSTLKFYIIGFSFLAIMYIAVIRIPASAESLSMAIALSFIIAIAYTMMYGIMWSILSEVNIPVSYAATAIGVASIFAYTPDLFMHTIFGGMVDSYGADGYPYIFGTLSGLCILAVLLCGVLRRRIKKAGGDNV